MRNALRISTANANKAIPGRCSPLPDRGTADPALLAIDWASDLSREDGPRPPSLLLRLILDDALPNDGYRTFTDTVSRAAGESNPTEHPHSLIWKSPIIRYRFFEGAVSPRRISSVATIGARVIRTPSCLGGFDFADICAAGWQTTGPCLLTWFGSQPGR